MPPTSPAARFWVYQSERFPLPTYATLVAALVLGAFGYVAAHTGRDFWFLGGLVAWTTVLGLFFQLRVADEFKDAAIDARFRPYRPVPRGLISLRELGWLALVVGSVQFLLNLWADPRLLPFLACNWLYLSLMRREFFVHDWLVARPLLYMLSHMLIMLFMFLYLASVGIVGATRGADALGIDGWWDTLGRLPPGVGWFLLAGYANGLVFEIARKVRAPADEEIGVETYSGLWGVRRAAWAWLFAVLGAGLGVALAGWYVNAGLWLGAALLVLFGLAALLAFRYAKRPAPATAKAVDRFSALWVLALYGLLFAMPWLV